MKPETFARICYLCLMDHHSEGWQNAHFSYINEKIRLLDAGYEAFNYLDDRNQQTVRDYFLKWNLEFPNLDN